MAKQGMKRPDRTHTHPKNEYPPVPRIQSKTGAENSWGHYDNDLARDNLEPDIPDADLQDM